MSKEEESIIPIDNFNNKNTKAETVEEVSTELEDLMEWAEIYGPDNFRKKVPNK